MRRSNYKEGVKISKGYERKNKTGRSTTYILLDRGCRFRSPQRATRVSHSSRRRPSCSRAGRPKSSIDLFLSLDPHPRRPRGGAVRRVWRKGATKVFKYGGKSPRVPTLTELFPKIQEYDWSLILSISANPRGASKQMKQVYLKGAWVYRPFPVVELKIWYRVNSLPLLLVRFSVHIYCCTRLEISHRFHCAPKQENKNTKGT